MLRDRARDKAQQFRRPRLLHGMDRRVEFSWQADIPCEHVEFRPCGQAVELRRMVFVPDAESEGGQRVLEGLEVAFSRVHEDAVHIKYDSADRVHGLPRK